MSIFKKTILTFVIFTFTAASPSAFSQLLVTMTNNSSYVHVSPINMKLYASKTGVGTWGVYQQVDAGGGYIAFKSYGNAKYLSVQDNTYIKPTATTLGDYEKFTPVYQGNGNWALRAKRNNAYITSKWGPLAATQFSITATETFGLGQVVDMWWALNSFAWTSPNKIKKSSTYSIGLQTTYEVQEGAHYWWYWEVDDDNFPPDNIHPGWDKNTLTWLGDWEYWTCIGTLPNYIAGQWWTGGGIPRCPRYLDPYQPGVSELNYVTTYRDLYNPCSPVDLLGQANVWGSWNSGYLMDLSTGRDNSQINMGNRWVIDIYYQNQDGEYWTFDLGPAVGNFDPQYGCVHYDNDDSDYPVDAVFNNVQDKGYIYPVRCNNF